MLAVFAEFERDILRERVKAGIVQAREKGKVHGRPATAAKQAAQVKQLFKKGMSKSEIARRLKIGRTSVIRILSRGR
jgi:putative DNA-invertase from lambdoid prophage Rac